MAHKVHQKIFRIRNLEDWDSRGFYGKNFPQYLEEDFRIKEFLKNKLKEAMVENVEIDRSGDRLDIIIKTARPGLIIGRRGGGVEALKKMVEKELLLKKETSLILFRRKKTGVAKPENAKRLELRIEIREVKNPWTSASLSAQWVAQQIEKRNPFRQVLKNVLSKITSSKEVKGARIQVAGRLNGVEIARREWLAKGQLPRQTLRADIDYAQTEAHCTYGAIGVRVWIYKGEKAD